jgi:hypothetical protein
MTLSRTLSRHAKSKESGYHHSIWVTQPPSLLTSSRYRDDVLEFANVLRTKSYKYKQHRGYFYDFWGDNTKAVCALGLFNNEKNGHPLTISLGTRLPRGIIIQMNDVQRWTFAQIADELERGVSIIQ